MSGESVNESKRDCGSVISQEQTEIRSRLGLGEYISNIKRRLGK